MHISLEEEGIEGFCADIAIHIHGQPGKTVTALCNIVFHARHVHVEIILRKGFILNCSVVHGLSLSIGLHSPFVEVSIGDRSVCE